jgi:hypothetical protein
MGGRRGLPRAAEIAALAIEHGLVLATHDHGFRRFTQLRVFDPLLTNARESQATSRRAALATSAPRERVEGGEDLVVHGLASRVAGVLDDHEARVRPSFRELPGSS